MLSRRVPSLNTTFLLMLLVFLCLPVLLLGIRSIFREIHLFRQESERLRNTYLAKQQAILQDEVKQALRYMRYHHAMAETRLRQDIRQRVDEAHALVMHLYATYQATRPLPEIQAMAREALRPIRFNQERGYYFATNLNGTEELFADRPEVEGQNLLSVQDTQGQYVIRDMIAIARQDGEGFYQYTWTKPGQEGRDFRKIAFVKYVAPFDWLIGTGEYLDDVEADIQRELLDYLRNVRFGSAGYLFGSTYHGDPLFTNGEITIGTGTIWDLTDPQGVKIFQEQRQAAMQPEGGFVRYSWKKLNTSTPSPKLSFVKGFPPWEWILGAGVYLDEIEDDIQRRHEVMQRDILATFTNMGFVLAGLLLGMSLVANLFTRRLRRNFTTFSSFFHNAATQAHPISEDMIHFQEFRQMAASANRMLEERQALERQRHTTEHALRASKEQFRKLFQTVQAGVLVQNADGSLVHSNDMACEIFNMAASDLTLRTPIDPTWHMILEDGTPVSGEDHPSMITLRTGKPIRDAVRGLFGDDRAKLRWLLINTAPIFEPGSDHVEQVMITFLDITRLKQAEEKIRILNADLEKRVQERTAALEAANRELKDFAYVVSHDLKAPLRGISRLASWLHEDYADGLGLKGLQMTDALVGRVKRLDRFIDGLLEYSRIGRIEGARQPVDLNRLIADILETLAPRPQITVIVAPDLPVITADQTRLWQVFQNLLSNAIKFMDHAEEGRITIDVTAEEDLWTFRVADTGPGIDPKYHDRIFKIFQTLTPRDVQENTGIGLALVKKIIELYGGKIWVESEPGRGSAFLFTLPKSSSPA